MRLGRLPLIGHALAFHADSAGFLLGIARERETWPVFASAAPKRFSSPTLMGCAAYWWTGQPTSGKAA